MQLPLGIVLLLQSQTQSIHAHGPLQCRVVRKVVPCRAHPQMGNYNILRITELVSGPRVRVQCAMPTTCTYDNVRMIMYM